jgi:uncharacterized PurR-regulated membrane protein YhhQ (DUF165 family)
LSLPVFFSSFLSLLGSSFLDSEIFSSEAFPLSFPDNLLVAIFLASSKTQFTIASAVLPPLYSAGVFLLAPKNLRVGKPLIPYGFPTFFNI